MFVSANAGSGEDPKKARQVMAAMMGPGHVDQSIRMAVHHCWMMLPEDRRNPAELERQLKRILDRALTDFAEDLKNFGMEHNA